jgi:photosystem II stability/assembly factor-like uncharacterized protein
MFLASSGRGAPWKAALSFSSPRAQALVDIAFLDENLGIAVGSIEAQSLILVTGDGGQTWHIRFIEETTDPDTILRRICFRSKSEIWVVGGSSIYVSRDGGSNWTLSYQGSGELLNDIAITQSGVFVVGGFGEILHSPDYGATWKKIVLDEPLASRFLWSIAFVDSQRGWVAGDKGTIASTADGGRTWQLEESNQSGFIRDVKVSGDKVFAVGDDGTILQRSLNSASRSR